MTSGSLVTRMKGAALMDRATYEAVERDPAATGQAAVVVGSAAAAAAIGQLRLGLPSMVMGAVSSVLVVALFAGLTYLIGRQLFDADATWGEVFRTLGFAQAPRVLLVFSGLFAIGWLVEAIVLLWVLWASIVAIRQALDIATEKAVVTGMIAFVAWLAIDLLVF